MIKYQNYLYHICKRFITEGTKLIKIRNKGSIVIGVIILLLLAPSVLNNSVSFSVIAMILISIYIILNGILNNKTKILSISLGFAMLISFILFVTQKTLSPIDTTFGVIIALIYLIMGIMIYFGVLPEKWINT
jgi:hypothetical protein